MLTKGCDNTELVSTYQNRSDPKYLNSLGLTIVNFLRYKNGFSRDFLQFLNLIEKISIYGSGALAELELNYYHRKSSTIFSALHPQDNPAGGAHLLPFLHGNEDLCRVLEREVYYMAEDGENKVCLPGTYNTFCTVSKHFRFQTRLTVVQLTHNHCLSGT